MRIGVFVTIGTLILITLTFLVPSKTTTPIRMFFDGNLTVNLHDPYFRYEVEKEMEAMKKISAEFYTNIKTPDDPKLAKELNEYKEFLLTCENKTGEECAAAFVDKWGVKDVKEINSMMTNAVVPLFNAYPSRVPVLARMAVLIEKEIKKRGIASPLRDYFKRELEE